MKKLISFVGAIKRNFAIKEEKKMSRKILVGLAVACLVIFGWSQMSVAATFSNADFNGTWNMYSNWQEPDSASNGWKYGTMTSDGAGNITGGTYTDQDGITGEIPANLITYTINADGTITMGTSNNDMFLYGAMNASKDVIAYVNTGLDTEVSPPIPETYNFGVMIKNQAGNFSNADFSGTWSFYNSWQEENDTNNGWLYGTMTSDGDGNITAGAYTASSGETEDITGTYTVNADGTLNITSGELTINGAMNDSKDVIAWVGTSSIEAPHYYHAGAFIKNQAGDFSDSDFSGTWSICSAWQLQEEVNNGWEYGSKISDGDGNITGGTYVNQDGESGEFQPSTYAVNSDGAINIPEALNFHGAMSDSKDVAGYILTFTDSHSRTNYEMGVLVCPQVPIEEEEEITTTTSGDSGGGGGCFIATAAYRTPMTEEVKSLCKFRDNILLKTTAGRDFVKLYYKTSPPIADFIRNKPALKAIVRIGLKPLVWLSKN